MDDDEKKRGFLKWNLTKGGGNLVILGIASAVVALATTSVSLMIYHNSGDIYLDRSRPGFLPDEAELQGDEVEEDYDFGKIDKLNAETVEEYLKNLETEIKAIDEYETPFGSDALSDKTLGIPDSQ